MKKRILSAFLCMCMMLTMVPAAFAVDTQTDSSSSSQVVRIQDTDTWYADATKAFQTKESYWFDIVTAQPAGYAVSAEGNSKTVTISSPEGLVWWAKQVNNGTDFSGYTVSITGDLDLSARYWTPICTGEYKKGEDGKWSVAEKNVLEGTTIDGGGHKITGLATSTGLRGPNQDSKPGDGSNCYYDAAFIGYSCCDITVQNLTFDGARIAITEPFDEVVNTYGSSMLAVVVGAQSGGSLTLKNVIVNDADVLAMQKASAFVGNLMGGSKLTVEQCAITNSRFSAYFMVAPIASYGAKDQVTIDGINLDNNTVRVVEQSGSDHTYTYNEQTGAEYWNGDLNASTTTVFHDDDTQWIPVAEVNGYQYGTLADAINAAESGDTVTLLRDTVGSITIDNGKTVTLNLNGHTLSNATQPITLRHGNLTLTGTGTVTETNDNGFGAVMVYGSTNNADQNYSVLTVDRGVTLGGWSGIFIDRNDNNACGVIINFNGAIVSPAEGTTTPGNAFYINGTIQNKENYPKITMGETASITATGNESCAIYAAGYAHWTINGGTYIGDGALEIKAGVMEINGGTFVSSNGSTSHEPNGNGTSSVGYALAVVNNQAYAGHPDVNVSGGKFASPVAMLDDDANAENNSATLSITGGYFTSDPSDYIAEGYGLLASDDYSYEYMVGEKANTDVDVEPAKGDPVVDGSALSGLSEEDKTAVTKAASSVTDNGELAKAANQVIEQVTQPQKIAAESALTASGVQTDGEDITVYAQTYLDIRPTEYDSTNKSLTLDITPMYRIVASTASNASAIKVVGEIQSGETANAVVLNGSEDELNIQTMTISLTLPSGFVNNANHIFVQHKGYEYTADVVKDDDDYIATFTNPHGFSEFTFTTASQAVAEIGSTRFTSLQDAIDEVENGQTITLLKNGQSAVVSKAVQFKLSGDYTANIRAGSRYSLTYDEETGLYSVSYVGSSGSSSGGSSSGGGSTSSNRYTISVPTDIDNGSISVSPSRAERGDTVTITVKPDEGYKLHSLIALDSDGDRITIEKERENIYTFEMPSDRVTIEATFAEIEDQPTSLPFNDVSTSDWFYDEVMYAYENSIMNGMGNNQFQPNATTNRAMVVTILYRLAGSPDLSDENLGYPFADVDASSWYGDAVYWARLNGITNGISNTNFGPDGSITREQMAALLYRYADFAGYDVSTGGMSLSEYADASEISSYAVTAMQWANENGLITGRSATTLAPKGTATRAEVATILMRFCEDVAK